LSKELAEHFDHDEVLKDAVLCHCAGAVSTFFCGNAANKGQAVKSKRDAFKIARA
jgi:hypothetical protein